MDTTKFNEKSKKGSAKGFSSIQAQTVGMKKSLEGSKRHLRENSALDLDMQVIGTVGCKVNNEINMLKQVKQNTVSTIPGPFSPGATVSPT